MSLKTRNILLILSGLMALTLFFVSLVGISDHPYELETLPWKIQCLGQDRIDLFIVLPALIISSLLLHRRPAIGVLVWPGVLLYLVYTFVIYCFDVHFNALFLPYCLMLSLSLNSLVYFMVKFRVAETGPFKPSFIHSLVAGYLLLLGICFSALWILDISKAIKTAALPSKLLETNLPTNPVQVLDLAVVLPWFFMAALLIMFRNPWALCLSASLLSFSVLMHLTIFVLTMFENGQPVMLILFGTLASLSMLLLLVLVRTSSTYYKPISLAHENTS